MSSRPNQSALRSLPFSENVWLVVFFIESLVITCHYIHIISLHQELLIFLGERFLLQKKTACFFIHFIQYKNFKKNLFAKNMNLPSWWKPQLYLSHQRRVLNLSGPIIVMAAFTLVVFTDNSEVG